MSKHTKAPWMAVAMEDGHVVVGPDGYAVCGLPHIARTTDEATANAELIALAPELFRSVCELVAVMRASDVEANPGKSCASDAWDAALDDAQALLDLLAEADISRLKGN